ncbi:MAG: cobalamin-binding protein [Actinobacteria bacterium]|nr:cobalamin-binding protein [Actinomycetota bacterium]
MRIVSLLPSATEIVCALGRGDDLVGVTFECDHPAGVRDGRVIVVGGLATEGLDAAAIDELVRERVAAGEDLYVLDRDRFRTLDPTVVLTQDLCRVCALPGAEVSDALAELGCTAAVVTLDPHTLHDVLDGVLAVGRAIDAEAEAAALVEVAQQRLAAVARAVAGRAQPTVLVLEWPDPPFVAGHWVPELVERAGGAPVLCRPGDRSVPTTWEEVAGSGAEVVLVASCGFDVEGSAAHARDLLDRLPVGAAVWALDANGVVVRPGPRLVDGVEVLAALLHGVGVPDPATAVRIR